MPNSDPGSASEAFSRQSVVFDRLDESNQLSAHLRRIFRDEVVKNLGPQSSILELNCGTGLDALYFASRGHRIFATDIAPGMIHRLEEKKKAQGLEAQVRTKVLSFHDLAALDGEKFDHIISNFGGLNCTKNLGSVLKQLPSLLKHDGKVTLVIMPRVCPWELAMALKGKFRTAFRRFRSATPARVEGVNFYCYYYNPSFVIRHLRKDMKLLSLKGIYITVPPEFFSGFVERYPRAYKLLSRIDRAIAGIFPFNLCCDHYMITMQKRNSQ